ncbi:hypothetical protein N7468_000440 [Penicillium chermesinum]|uniref:Uncharacterized protein n=1 Tax=Penicillium chermesinum TaxID=63820 RepID=A0A9W9TYU8_9EURO|nr:uncharacterized protein N7468_000440 [Penicillium chermesinum]KAJ5248989.1 hypothetical protein N7468_000440 [Penicillium chermesinum]
MATTCLRYLCLDIFDPEIDPTDVKMHILSGRYGLYWFAASQLLSILQRCARLLADQALPDLLKNELTLFCQIRGNISFDPAAKDDKKAVKEQILPEEDVFQTFKPVLPEEHRFLHHALALRSLDNGKWRLDQEIAIIIHEQFEALLCQTSDHSGNCACAKLKQHYGARLFRCHYVICQPQRISFERFSSREIPSKNHSRSYKCPHTGCAFYSLGFSSPRQLDKHIEKCHRDTQPRSIQILPDPDSNELVPLLSDLIALGRTAEVEALCTPFQSLNSDSQLGLLDHAAHSGPLQMVKALYSARTESILHTLKSSTRCEEANAICGLACSSLSGENLDVLEWLSLKTHNVCDGCGSLVSGHFEEKFFVDGISSDSDEVFEAWRKCFASAICYPRPLYRLPAIMDRMFIWQIREPIHQDRLAGVWEDILHCGKFDNVELGYTLTDLAKGTCSVALAKVLLSAGVDVDFRLPEVGREQSTRKTPLHFASRKTTREAAEMMKLLLIWGANPNAEARTPWSHSHQERSRDENVRPRRRIVLVTNSIVESSGNNKYPNQSNTCLSLYSGFSEGADIK